MSLRINTILLIITLIISLLTINKKSERYLRYFPFFLATTTLVELSAIWLSFQHQNNTLLYNLYSIIEFSFFLYLFYQLLEKPSIKKLTIWLGISLPVICLVDIFLIQGPRIFHTYTFILGALVLDILGILYLVQLLNSSTNIRITKIPAFWIVIAILFFYISTPSFLGVLNYIASLPRKATMPLTYIMVVVDSLYYLLIIVALLCRINIRKYLFNF